MEPPKCCMGMVVHVCVTLIVIFLLRCQPIVKAPSTPLQLITSAWNCFFCGGLGNWIEWKLPRSLVSRLCIYPIASRIYSSCAPLKNPFCRTLISVYIIIVVILTHTDNTTLVPYQKVYQIFMNNHVIILQSVHR